MKLWRSIKNHLLPWRGNTHRPHILRRGWLVAFLALALVSEGVILSHTLVGTGPDVFLAAVVRSDVIDYTDRARVAEGGQPLNESELLNAAAQAKAEDMAARGYFSHVGPNGEEPWSWIERSGYEYVYAGENLAVRFDDSKDVVDAWMASPTHRANIVKDKYQEIGVGLAQGEYKGGQATFVVQYFASPQKTAAVPAAAAVPAKVEETALTEVAVAEPISGPAEAAVAGAQTDVAAVKPAMPQQTPRAQSVARSITQALGEADEGASWALSGVAALLITVLALTFFVRIQVQPTDLLLPGLAVALIVVTLMAANAKFLPGATQSASVANSLPGDIAGGSAIERVSAFPDAPAN